MSKLSKSFMSKLEDIKNSTIKVPVISTKKKVDASPLTLKQQKEIVSAIADGMSGVVSGLALQYKIIIDNVDNGGALKAYDRSAIILKLRCDSLGNVINIDAETLDVTPILERFDKLKEINSSHLDEDLIVEHDGITMKLTPPTIDREYKLMKSCSKFVSSDIDDSENMGNMYMFELLKFIDTVKVEVSEGEFETVKFSELTSKDAIKLIESLPLSFYDELSTYSKKFTDFDKELLTIDDKTIKIDATLFDKAV